MQKEELEADVVAYSAVISSCATSGEWQRALGCLEAMQADHELWNLCKPTFFVFAFLQFCTPELLLCIFPTEDAMGCQTHGICNIFCCRGRPNTTLYFLPDMEEEL